MARIKRGVPARARHKKILKLAKGYFGRSKSCYRVAIEKVEKALRYAYRDRRNRRRSFRKLWITRINAGCREQGLTYSRFINGLKLVCITMNRKMLSELAAREPESFKAIVTQAAAALKNAAPKKKAA